MAYQLVTVTPGTQAVSTADVKTFARLNTSAEDTLISDWVYAASAMFERQSGYSPSATTFRLQLDDWPGTIYLPRRPVTSVTSVEYLNTTGTWTTVSGTTNDLDNTPPRVLTPQAAPTLHPTSFPRVRVTFVAGGADKLVSQAIKLLVCHWLQHREAYGTDTLKETPDGWRSVVDMYRDGCNYFPRSTYATRW